MPWIQVACLAVLGVAYGLVFFRSAGRGTLLAQVALLALAAWVGEATCIAAYRFYGYQSGWWLRLAGVPLLVPVIWPLVVLQSRNMVHALWPGRWWSPLAVGAMVAFDGSLVEVVAVRAGLWHWSEQGLLEVPLAGILGWGFFGVGAALVLDRAGDRPSRLLLLPIIAPVVTHLLILVSWWGLLRWTMRGDLGVAGTIGALAVSLLISLAVWRARPRRVLPMEALPTIPAVVFFLTLLILNGAGSWQLWAHFVLVSLPHLISLGLQPQRNRLGGSPERSQSQVESR